MESEIIYAHEDKQKVREAILSLIKEEDSIIFLDSKYCLMLKECLKRGITNVYIPNNEEFKEFPKELERYIYPFSLAEFLDIVDLDIASIKCVWADFCKTWESQKQEIISLFKRQLLQDNSYLIVTCSLRDFSKNEVIRDIIVFTESIARPEGYAIKLMPETSSSGNGTLTVFLKVYFDNVVRCLRCKSSKIFKNGMRYNKSEAKQKYHCESCNFKFVLDGSRFRYPIYVREYIKRSEGSLRKIQKEVNQKFRININHASVHRIRRGA